MASAIMAGARAGDAPADRPSFLVAEPDADRRRSLEAIGLAEAVPTAGDLLSSIQQGEIDALVLAVKPQVFPKIATELREAGGLPECLVVSIMAGTTTAGIADALSGSYRVVRVMPNTPARVRQGCSAIAAGPTATGADLALTRRLMAAVGTVVELPESLMDAFTGVAGSGPAFVFAFAEALVAAATEVGIPAEQADGIVRQLLLGSVQLIVNKNGEGAGGGLPDLAELRRAVTSPGGTTAAGLGSLERDGLAAAVARAVRAARDRGRELSGGETG